MKYRGQNITVLFNRNSFEWEAMINEEKFTLVAVSDDQAIIEAKAIVNMLNS